MPFDTQRARQHLTSFDLQKLFIQEMGWDRASQRLEVPFNGETVVMTAVAQKRGLMALLCAGLQDGQIPDYAGRRKIEALVRKSVHEHILIFTNADRTRQVWQWVRREPGRPTTSREFEVSRGQRGEALLTHLQQMVFALAEEEELGIVDVTSRVRAAFDVERVTRRFYERFQSEHAALLGFLEGIPDEEMQRWYVSVTMNRLMFVYFIQKKGFLNGDLDYLRNRLLESKFRAADRFYADFLCPLFFEGFAQKERSEETKKLLGNVPYLNGGIFQKHEIEKTHGRTIQIPDRAFERVFDFFDQYRWHLDERPLRNDTEINPDVLGYIFEKYINQREMGAYYTKEDITGYISKSTVLPYLLDQARKDCAIAFNGEHAVWRLLQSDPERYIYDAVKKGCGLVLPAEIAAGIDDVAQRGEWNRTAAEELALPTETWREVVARRERFEEVRGKLAAGEVRAVDELITYNLDIQQFTQDAVEESEGPELLRAFWKGLRGVKVLDPTCGSGAFLFAALNLLEPLYEACLERMAAFVSELDASEEKHRPEKYADFRKVLEEVGKHPNRRYFILKSIIVNNLYGVDIMAEAVEICKLRLFLKLIAQIEKADQIEPLPDIDFNIRTGNTLVGFIRFEEVRQALTTDAKGQMFIPTPEIAAQLAQIVEEVDVVSRAISQFKQQQLNEGFVKPEDKLRLQRRFDKLKEELDRALARVYKTEPDSLEFSPWLEKHRPFHWYIEFPGMMDDGGFDVIVGNPPYVEYSQLRNSYKIINYQTVDAGNLYSYVIERSYSLLENYKRIGLIVQLPIVCTDRMKPLQNFVLNNSQSLWFANFDDRPSRLFDGLEHIRATIINSSVQKERKNNFLFSTTYNRWYSEQRSTLFDTLIFIDVAGYKFDGSIPKIGSEKTKSILNKIRRRTKLGTFLRRMGNPIYFHNAPQYWTRATNFIPYFWNERDGEQASTQIRRLFFQDKVDSEIAMVILNSSLFYLWFILLSDCRHLNSREVDNFPVGFELMSQENKNELLGYAKKLMDDYGHNKRRRDANYKTTGKVSYDEYYPSLSKMIIDKIDHVLAEHYGFTDEELDFIINYDIKYRMGAEE